MKTTIQVKLTRNVRVSIDELYQVGFTRTGKSSYSKGWANKSVWTSDVITACKSLGINYEVGNDAPRGGASGEYVRLMADKRKNRKVWAAIDSYRKGIDAAKAAVAAYEAKKEIRENEIRDFVKENKTSFLQIPGENWAQTCYRHLRNSGFNLDTISYNKIKAIVYG